MYESSWLWIAPAVSENNGLMKTAVNRTAKTRKPRKRVCDARLPLRPISNVSLPVFGDAVFLGEGSVVFNGNLLPFSYEMLWRGFTG